MNHRTVVFVIAVLYGLDEERRGVDMSPSFSNLLRSSQRPNLHLAWLKLKKEGLLGEFAEEFCFDPLYGKMNELELAISTAVRSMLVRQDGTRFDYHLDALEREDADNIARAAHIPQALVEKARTELNRFLNA